MSEEFKSEIDVPFTMIPNIVWEIGLSGNEMIVLHRILFRAGLRGKCFENRESFAEACRLNKSTISIIFGELESLNIIEVRRRRSENKPNLIRVKNVAQWLCKSRNSVSQSEPSRKIRQGLVGKSDEASRKIRHGTKLPELNSNELNSVLVAAGKTAAPETALTIQTEQSKKQEPPTAPAWKAYAELYERRYNVPPTRNQKVNSQLKQFCERVGYQNAPDVLRFYVLQNDAFYCKDMHTIGIALRDAEKLSAGYRRGALISRREAEYIDKTTSAKSNIDTIAEDIYHEDAQKGGTYEF